MAWVRIEDGVTEHRKHLKAGPAAAWLWVCGIAYCQRQLSDGFIPIEAVPLLGVPQGFSRLVERLVEVGLFDRVDGGYAVHDYHDFNDTRQEALARKADLSAKRSAAGRLGGLKGGRGRQNHEANSQQDGQANATANAKQVAEAKIGPIPSHPIPSSVPLEPQRETRARRNGPQTGLLKPHGNVAFESLGVVMPWDVYHKLVNLRKNNTSDVAALFEKVSIEWSPGGIHEHDEPGANAFRFWDARYDEQWPATKPAAPAAPAKTAHETAQEREWERNRLKYAGLNGTPIRRDDRH